MDKLIIGSKEFSSRLFLGTGKFSSGKEMRLAVEASGTQMVTVALKRMDLNPNGGAHNGSSSLPDGSGILEHLDGLGLQILPNTSGVRTAKEAVFAAELAREALETSWVKLEIHPDPRYLLPDPIETLEAARELVKKGFIVLPYIHADPVLCKRLEDVGVAAVMPLGAPIGSNKGLSTRDMLEIIIRQSNVPVVVDAGLGRPSHAAEALEMGADAVLVNTAIAVAHDPRQMAEAFKWGVAAGRKALLSGVGNAGEASPSSPLTAFLEEA